MYSNTYCCHLFFTCKIPPWWPGPSLVLSVTSALAYRYLIFGSVVDTHFALAHQISRDEQPDLRLRWWHGSCLHSQHQPPSASASTASLPSSKIHGATDSRTPKPTNWSACPTISASLPAHEEASLLRTSRWMERRRLQCRCEVIWCVQLRSHREAQGGGSYAPSTSTPHWEVWNVCLMMARWRASLCNFVRTYGVALSAMYLQYNICSIYMQLLY